MNKSVKYLMISLAVVTLGGATTYFYFGPQANQSAQDQIESLSLHVYKTPTCGCCSKWLDHLEEQNIKVTFSDMQNVAPVKQQHAIEQQYWSCHTGMSQEGYVFEGHVPAKYVRQFLASPDSNAIGLSVPAMPVGSPGMEYNDQFMPYQVLLLKKDGSAEVYADVKNYSQQF